MSVTDEKKTTDADSLREDLAKLEGTWYSPIDLGHGVITRGPRIQKRFARRIKLLEIPEDLAGKRVLDIGAYDGFFSFEFERRGAEVLSIDVWTDLNFEKFQFARKKKNSQIKYKRLDVHDLSPETVGTFDIVFCAGVLYHLRHPLLALERIRSVTGNLLILETVTLVMLTHESTPMIGFMPGDEEAVSTGFKSGICGGATVSWLQLALRSAGFARVEVKYLPSMRWWRKMVALFTNKPQGGRGIYHAYVK